VAVAKDARTESQAASDVLGVARLTPAEAARLTERVRSELARAPQAREAIVELRKRAAPAKAVTQVVVSIGAIIGCFFAPVIGGKIGRRPAYFGLCLLSLVLCGYQFRCLSAYDSQFLAISGIVGCVTAAFYGWLPLYLPELFPTRVRATGQGLSFNFGRILAAAGAVQMGQLVSLLGGSYARAGAAITLIYTLGLFLIWLAPETKGKPLPE
jgi:MFS family permease